MSTTDDSFIVLEETPSMLQFSLLGTSILDNGTKTNSIDDTKYFSGLEFSPSVTSGCLTDLNGAIKNSIANLSSVSEYPSTSATKSQSVNIDTKIGDHQQKQTPPKTTLAQSFLLGDINCDKMKVNIRK